MEDKATLSEIIEKEKLIRRTRDLLLRTKVLHTNLLYHKSPLSDGVTPVKELPPLKEKLSCDGEIEQSIQTQIEVLKEQEDKLERTKSDIQKIKLQILTRTSTLLQDLWQIYPITEFPDQRGYSICDIHLPNSKNFDGHDETMISTALGYVVHLMEVLCDILDVPLLFPLKNYGSRSVISCNIRNQTFSLHIESFKSNKESTSLSNGVNLLNLNIVELRSIFGMQTNDISDTLGNLYSFKHMLESHIYKDKFV